MTNAEAFEFLKEFLKDKPDFRKTHPGQDDEVYRQMDRLAEAIDMAITALRNEKKSEESLLKADPDNVSKGDVIYRQVAAQHEMTLTLNNPLTEEQWDAIADVDFEHTNEIVFHTKHGKEVTFVKASAQPEPQWISVEERLPEEDDVYLVTVDPRYIAFGVTQIDMLNWYENKWWYFDIDERPAVFPDPIIAWMPLPAPYSEEPND